MSTSLRQRIGRVALCGAVMAGGIFGASRLELARLLDTPAEPSSTPVVSLDPVPRVQEHEPENEALEGLVASLTASDGNEPGGDTKNVPRPSASKRIYGAPLDAQGTRLVVYAVNDAPEAALETFAAELVRAGFTAVPRTADAGPMRETFTRPNVRVVVSATRTHEEHTLLSIVEMSAGRT